MDLMPVETMAKAVGGGWWVVIVARFAPRRPESREWESRREQGVKKEKKAANQKIESEESTRLAVSRKQRLPISSAVSSTIGNEEQKRRKEKVPQLYSLSDWARESFLCCTL